ncbi:hypothetical protein OS493_025171 [Desmophyllum pertusum]|uniref:Uncharacterized protein n=1 Tax=Desmophyllum pertusum TaxID=174260 RepID=A0A9W9ZZ02_9CNID|nr:hypothetical protein OS493_025171 [Desmophyllum pertusum]
MIELEFRLIFLGVAWVVCSTGVVSSNDIPAPESNRLLDDCKRECHDIVPTDVPGKESEQSTLACVEKCLLLAQEENVTATSAPITRSTSELFSLTTLSTTDASKYACPRDYGPGPGQMIPGEVSEVAVTFVQEKKQNGLEWVAKVNWTAPKDVNESSIWRGYLVIWFSDTDSVEDKGDPGRANCKPLPKNQRYLDINETDGWNYPDRIYVGIVALPTEKQAFRMEEYDPSRADRSSLGRYVPAIKLKGHKRFQLQSAETVVLLIVAGLVVGFAMMWVVHICIMKRKNFTAYNYQVEITTVEPEKAEKKNADELKDKLIM